jgi:hypothetical protein
VADQPSGPHRHPRRPHHYRLNEDTFSIQLIDANERLVAIEKSDIKEYEKGATSTMPSVQGKLSGDEIADLIAYLLSLKG